jgi:hypothetical protein
MTPMLGIMASQISGHLSSFYSIATVTGTGSNSTITFSSIPSTYSHLQIRYSALAVTGGNNINIRFNGVSTSVYSQHTLTGNGSSASATGSGSTTNLYGDVGGVTGAGTTKPLVSIFDVINYASTTKYKTVRAIAGIDNNGSGAIALTSGSWQSTSAITSITLDQGGDSFATGSTFALYGIK